MYKVRELNLKNEFYFETLQLFVELQLQHPDTDPDFDFIKANYLFSQKLLAPGAKVFGLFYKSELVGYTLCYEWDATNLLSDGTYVIERHRKTKGSYMLVKKLLGYAKKNYKKLTADLSTEDAVKIAKHIGARISHIRFTKEF